MTSNKRFFALLIGSAFAAGIALASWELLGLHRAINAAHNIASAIAAPGASQGVSVSVSVTLFFGLFFMGRVEHPYLVVAAGDFVLGALAGGLAFLLVYALNAALPRSPAMAPQSK